MAFLPNIPQPTDQLATSQPDLLNNFGILGAIAGNANASSASINGTSGFNWLYLPPNGATPPSGSAFAAANVALYSAASTVSTQNELFIKKRNQATVVQVPATASVLSVNSGPNALAQGWTYLPSGILMKWAGGQTANGPTTITFPVSANIPAFTVCMNVFIVVTDPAAGDANQAVRLVSLNNLSFVAYGSARTTAGAAAANFGYLSIGY